MLPALLQQRAKHQRQLRQAVDWAAEEVGVSGWVSKPTCDVMSHEAVEGASSVPIYLTTDRIYKTPHTFL